MTDRLENKNTRELKLLPSSVDIPDYLEFRETVFSWFSERKLRIWEAEKVLETLKSDLLLQKCVGLSRYDG